MRPNIPSGRAAYCFITAAIIGSGHSIKPSVHWSVDPAEPIPAAPDLEVHDAHPFHCDASPAPCRGRPRWRRARAARMFTAEHDAFWAAARKAHGDAPVRERSSRCCYCTAIWIGSLCSPASPRRCRSDPPARCGGTWPRIRRFVRPCARLSTYPPPQERPSGSQAVMPGVGVRQPQLGGEAQRHLQGQLVMEHVVLGDQPDAGSATTRTRRRSCRRNTPRLRSG
jgi:hypothetical protein